MAWKFNAGSCWCTGEDDDFFIFSHIRYSFNKMNVVLLTEHHSVIAKKSCNCFCWHYECFQINITYLNVLRRCVKQLVTI